MDEEGREMTFMPPSMVCLTPTAAPTSRSTRRLSCHFRRVRAPPPAPPALAWLSLEGRLVGAEDACSASSVAAALPDDQKIAWELFPPIHRVLVVAVAAAAAADSEKNSQIVQLRRSVEVRDQILLGMQQKLDDLVEKLNFLEDQSGISTRRLISDVEFELDDGGKNGILECCDHQEAICASGVSETKSGVPISFQHLASVDCTKIEAIENDSGEDIFPFHCSNYMEQEERRMSDLSDWCSTAASTGDLQMHSVANEQEIYNLRKQCDEKDATIKELYTIAHASDTANSMRISELEDIIRRKSTTITRLKKDMLIIEQKVLQLTRQKRPSFMDMNADGSRLPVMATNLVYDMDSSTTASSSDSDCPDKLSIRQPLVDVQMQRPLSASSNSKNRQSKGKVTPSGSVNGDFPSQSSSSLDNCSSNRTNPPTVPRFRRRLQDLSGSKSITHQKRWF